MQVKIEGKMSEKGAYRVAMILNLGIVLFLALVGTGILIWAMK